MRVPFLFVLCLQLCAQSQQPPPGPSKATQAQQQNAQGKNDKRDIEQKKSSTIPAGMVGETQRSDKPNSSPDRSTNDWLIVIPTIVIALAAIVQVFVYHRQADTMEKALGETKKAANAAQASSDALINSERAWLTVGLQPYAPEPSETKLQIALFGIENHGRTIATVVSAQARFHTVHVGAPLPTTPEYRATDRLLERPEPLVPQGKFSNIQVALIEGSINDWQFRELKRGDVSLCFYGRIVYLDFAKQQREAQFCFFYRFSDSSDFPDGWVRAGPEAYNRFT